MKRTRFPEKIIIPDAINCSIYDESFTTVPNSILRNPELSFKAKGIICLLLSNKEGWSTHLSTLKKISTDGTDGIQSGLQELEKAGYLLRVKYRDKQTKVWRGSFWAYTDIPHQFKIERTLKALYNQGLEPQPGFPDMETPDMANPVLIILNNNNTNNNLPQEEEILSKNGFIIPSQFEDFWEFYPRKVDKGKTLTIWNRICSRKENRPTWKEIKKAIYQQKKSERWKDPKFIPHPSTWLNQNRWLDDAKEMKAINYSTSNKPKYIDDPDGGRYLLNEKNGKYYHCRSGELYIP